MLRREFLKGVTFGAGAAMLAPRVWGADEVKAPAEPRDIVRVAFAGVRGRGADHVKDFVKMKDVKIAALIDPDENVIEKAMKAATDGGGEKPRYEKDIRRVLEDKNIDAVVIATPNHWHTLAAIWSLQAGKHVYVEKPVSQNVWESARMVEASRKYNRVAMTGTQRRSMTGLAQALEYMRSGKLGKPKLGRGIVYRARKGIGKKADAPIPAGVDYNLWLGPAAEAPFNPNRFHYEWHWNWNFGNGELGNNGIHMLDVVRWGLGKDSLPKRIMSIGGRYAFDDDGQTPNTHVIWYDYGDCQMICELRNLDTPQYHETKPDVVFHCENGILGFNGSTPTAYDLNWKPIETFKGGGSHGRKFIDACKKGALDDAGCQIKEGHLSTAICHLGNISHRVGETRSFDGVEKTIKDVEALSETYGRMIEHLKKNNISLANEKVCVGKMLSFDGEKFDDATATGLLRRDYRKGFEVPEKV